ncbi:hypothetical protein KBC75_03385 [Candidatus Shapirobacteria bacterium]|nr:hypothetical protein [Candidatus Shapirobacteria bacterium]
MKVNVRTLEGLIEIGEEVFEPITAGEDIASRIQRKDNREVLGGLPFSMIMARKNGSMGIDLGFGEVKVVSTSPQTCFNVRLDGSTWITIESGKYEVYSKNLLAAMVEVRQS